jgi:hypothetical protein
MTIQPWSAPLTISQWRWRVTLGRYTLILVATVIMLD